jgi:nucleotide-binding universal stress UspA family protein
MQLEQHVISSDGYSRTVWYRAGPQNTPHSLCIFLDAEHYTRDLDALPVLAALLDERGMPPLSLLFVSQVSSDPDQADYGGRQTDYVCNERYAGYIATDVTRPAEQVGSEVSTEQLLDGAAQRFADAGVQAEVRQLPGGTDTADAIVAVADEIGPDLVVIGLRRRTAVGKLIVGSTAQRILLGVACPVLAVKAPH